MKEMSFKQTEIGDIPVDWEVANINKTCLIKARIGWQGLTTAEYLSSGDYVLITGTDFDNGFIDWKHCNYVSKWRFEQDKFIQIKKGDVLITKDGTIGKVAFLDFIPMQGTLNSGVFVVRPKESFRVNKTYLSMVFKSIWFKDFIDHLTAGSTIVHLYQKDFVKFDFPVPPTVEEQERIADALSDVDRLLRELDGVIAKKRAIKQGAMQELLTGKRRLEGFTGEWEEKKISEVCERYDNLRIPVAENLREKGTTPYYGANGIQDYVKGYTHEGEFILLAEDGANSLTDYPIRFVEGKIWVNNHAHVLQAKPTIADNRFLSYAFKTIDFESNIVGGSRAKLNSETLMNLIFICPNNCEEQTAIANILSDMDEEIAALEAKRAKYEQVKQGMMQELLTGRIRLTNQTNQ